MVLESSVIAKRIKRFRTDSKLTQEQLGEKIGLSRNEISNLERNITSLSYPTLCNLCDALDICSCELICGEDHKTIDDNIISVIKHMDEDDKFIVYQMILKYKELTDELKRRK